MVSMIELAIDLASSSEKPVEKLIDILKKVFIGAGFLKCRGKGPCFGGNTRGADGFQTKFKDTGN